MANPQLFAPLFNTLVTTHTLARSQLIGTPKFLLTRSRGGKLCQTLRLVSTASAAVVAHPVRVMKLGAPAISAFTKLPKKMVDKSRFTCSWRTAAALGPCTAAAGIRASTVVRVRVRVTVRDSGHRRTTGVRSDSRNDRGLEQGNGGGRTNGWRHGWGQGLPGNHSHAIVPHEPAKESEPAVNSSFSVRAVPKVSGTCRARRERSSWTMMSTLASAPTFSCAEVQIF